MGRVAPQAPPLHDRRARCSTRACYKGGSTHSTPRRKAELLSCSVGDTRLFHCGPTADPPLLPAHAAQGSTLVVLAVSGSRRVSSGWCRLPLPDGGGLASAVLPVSRDVVALALT